MGLTLRSPPRLLLWESTLAITLWASAPLPSVDGCIRPPFGWPSSVRSNLVWGCLARCRRQPRPLTSSAVPLLILGKIDALEFRFNLLSAIVVGSSFRRAAFAPSPSIFVGSDSPAGNSRQAVVGAFLSPLVGSDGLSWLDLSSLVGFGHRWC